MQPPARPRPRRWPESRRSTSSSRGSRGHCRVDVVGLRPGDPGPVVRVYVAAFFSWTGSIVAHDAVTGVFVDPGGGGPEPDDPAAAREDVDGPVALVRVHRRSATAGLPGVLPGEPHRAAGFVVGVVVLVAGSVVLAPYVRQGNYLLDTVGGGLFLGGYAVAHYFDHGVLL